MLASALLLLSTFGCSAADGPPPDQATADLTNQAPSDFDQAVADNWVSHCKTGISDAMNNHFQLTSPEQGGLDEDWEMRPLMRWTGRGLCAKDKPALRAQFATIEKLEKRLSESANTPDKLANLRDLLLYASTGIVPAPASTKHTKLTWLDTTRDLLAAFVLYYSSLSASEQKGLENQYRAALRGALSRSEPIKAGLPAQLLVQRPFPEDSHLSQAWSLLTENPRGRTPSGMTLPEVVNELLGYLRYVP